MNRSRDTASRFVRAASLAEIPDGKSKAVNLDGRMIALFNTGDGVFAVDNRCPPYESVSRSAACGKLRASVDRGDEGRQLA
jgi:nitrite reductase/ring-hydroxylating ferredoxin subunit